MTIRNVPEELAQALDEKRRASGKSLNQTVIDLLRGGLGVGSQRTNGLEKLAGVWSQEDVEEFQRNTAFLEEIDEEMWQ
ncbi:MAG: hypothetical protein U5J83_10435 [Bryobacterales bacterium]|nr:hypothetical protein [Bryobacterales bacterium]